MRKSQDRPLSLPLPSLADRAFWLGPVFRRAADRHGAVFVTLDRPLDVSPSSGST